jgi:hypothetical protein
MNTLDFRSKLKSLVRDLKKKMRVPGTRDVSDTLDTLDREFKPEQVKKERSPTEIPNPR